MNLRFIQNVQKAQAEQKNALERGPTGCKRTSPAPPNNISLQSEREDSLRLVGMGAWVRARRQLN